MDNINIQELLARLAALEAQQEHLLQQQPQSNHAPEPKILLPERFNGDRKKYRGFINQIELVFMINPNRYHTDALKVGCIGSLLSDKALAWFTPFLEQPRKYTEVLNNYQEFRTLMDDTFGDKDRSIVAASKIQKLRQGKQPASSYAAEFRQIAADLTWNDSALIHQFRLGLRDDVKDMLLHHDYPKTLLEAINLAIQVDNRLYEHRQERNSIGNMQRKYENSSSSSNASQSSSNEPTSMILGATKRGPLTQEERKHRMENNLCKYCGSKDHFLNKCPLAKNKVNGGSGKVHRQ